MVMPVNTTEKPNNHGVISALVSTLIPFCVVGRLLNDRIFSKLVDTLGHRGRSSILWNEALV